MLTTSTISLLELPTHQLAYIDAITANPHFAEADDSISRRLYDLGFLPNTPIKVIAKGLFGKPPLPCSLRQADSLACVKMSWQRFNVVYPNFWGLI